SAESIASAKKEFQTQKNASWPAIKAYYAGYFSAHAIMRACGAGVSHLTGREFSHLIQVHSVYNPDQVSLNHRDFPSDIYFALRRSSSDYNSYTMTIRTSRAGRGVHETFSRDFMGFLDETSTKAAQFGLPTHPVFIADVIK